MRPISHADVQFPTLPFGQLPQEVIRSLDALMVRSFCDDLHRELSRSDVSWDERLKAVILMQANAGTSRRGCTAKFTSQAIADGDWMMEVRSTAHVFPQHIAHLRPDGTVTFCDDRDGYFLRFLDAACPILGSLELSSHVAHLATTAAVHDHRVLLRFETVLQEMMTSALRNTPELFTAAYPETWLAPVRESLVKL